MTDAPRATVSRYRCIVADPPWPQKGGGPLAGGHARGFVGTAGSLPMPYGTMTVADIAAMPVQQVVERDAHLYLWTTSRFLDDAFDVIRAWGFRYSTTLVWAKAPIGAGLGGSYGIATEFVLHARRGSLKATPGSAGTGSPGSGPTTSAASRCTPRNRPRCSRWWRPSALARGWNCSPAATAPAGTHGATRPRPPCGSTLSTARRPSTGRTSAMSDDHARAGRTPATTRRTPAGSPRCRCRHARGAHITHGGCLVGWATPAPALGCPCPAYRPALLAAVAALIRRALRRPR